MSRIGLTIGLLVFISLRAVGGENEPLFPTPFPNGKEQPSPTPAEDWTVITCEGNLLADYEKDEVTFYRNVVVKNPRGSVRADSLVLYFYPQGKKVKRVEGEGNVQVLMGERVGSSEKILYYPDQKKAILIGGATVREGQNVVRGTRITYYLDRKEMEVEAASEIEIYPKKDYDISF